MYYSHFGWSARSNSRGCMNKVLAFACLWLLTGCAIKQNVSPYTSTISGELCIIEDPAVRSGFLTEYRRTLNEMGIMHRVIPADSSIEECSTTSTYTARWSWDFTLYMSHALIKVYEAGQLTAEAEYDSRKGGLRLDKWKDAEPKIRELVHQLFPNY